MKIRNETLSRSVTVWSLHLGNMEFFRGKLCVLVVAISVLLQGLAVRTWGLLDCGGGGPRKGG